MRPPEYGDLAALARAKLYLARSRGWQGLADCLAHLGRLGFERMAEAAHLPPKAVHLIEQPEYQRCRLLVQREFAAYVQDQFDPRHVHLVEGPALRLRAVLALRDNPAVLDPSRQLCGLDPGKAPDQLVEPDHAAAAPCAVPAPIDRRGSLGCFFAHSSRNCASSASPLSPITTFSVTY